MCDLVAGYAATLQPIAGRPQGLSRAQFMHCLVDTRADATTCRSEFLGRALPEQEFHFRSVSCGRYLCSRARRRHAYRALLKLLPRMP
jgi:hypothetical protein